LVIIKSNRVRKTWKLNVCGEKKTGIKESERDGDNSKKWAKQLDTNRSVRAREGGGEANRKKIWKEGKTDPQTRVEGGMVRVKTG